MARLITELIEDVQFIVEEKDGKKHLYVEGPYISVNAPNRNNRIYSKELMTPVVETFLQKVKSGSAFGEFGHPQGPKINEERISHRIVDLNWKDNHVLGKSVVLDEGPGKMMKSIIETGGKLGMSTRGLGSVKPNDKGLQEVQNDFKLVTVDAVVEPSGLDCWVNGMMEGVEWTYDAAKGTFMENKIEQLQKTMKKLTVRELNEKRLNVFKYVLSGLSKPLYK